MTRRSSITLLGVAVAALAGLGAQIVSLHIFQVLLGGLLLAAAVWSDKRATTIPRMLRPATIAFGSLLIASIDTAGLTETQNRSYFFLWLLQVLGFGLGFLFFRDLTGRHSSTAKSVNVAALRRIALIMFVIFLLAGLTYWRSVGVSALGSNIEQSRVDAAQTSNGYLRTLAFLLPTAASLLVVTLRLRRAWLFVLITVVFLVGVGNRIPLVYFLFPLVAMAAVSGMRKIGSGKLVSAALLLVVVVGAFGAYRIFSQKQLLSQDPDYAVALHNGDAPSVAIAAVKHYAKVVPTNEMLVKRLVDDGAISYQYGKTYITLFITVLPGRQISPDMMIKEVSGQQFYGGGIPPTLAGEGYMNFGYLGVVLNAVAVMLLLRFWAMRVMQMRHADEGQRRVVGMVYGYVLTWCALAQISGFAGSATISLSSFLVYVLVRHLVIRANRDERVTERRLARVR